MAIPGSCVSAMEKPCFSITASPESATCLYTRNTLKRHAGPLASLASPKRNYVKLPTSPSEARGLRVPVSTEGALGSTHVCDRLSRSQTLMIRHLWALHGISLPCQSVTFSPCEFHPIIYRRTVVIKMKQN